ncbi:hypothetical protein Aduo_011364 [Ancylostoma duodenale]
MIVRIALLVTLVEIADMATKPPRPPNADLITPIPFDKINPRANEFRRLDSDGDEQITFTEFVLGDTRYIERQSAAFHKLDEDGDGIVSRAEYDAFYKRLDDDRRRHDFDRDNFFDNVGHIRMDDDHSPFFHDFDFPDHHSTEREERPQRTNERNVRNGSRHNPHSV